MCVRLFAAPWTVACQAPLSVGRSQQGYSSGLPFPPSGDLLDPGLNPHLLWFLHWLVGALPLSQLGITTLPLPKVQVRADSGAPEKTPESIVDLLVLVA